MFVASVSTSGEQSFARGRGLGASGATLGDPLLPVRKASSPGYRRERARSPSGFHRARNPVADKGRWLFREENGVRRDSVRVRITVVPAISRFLGIVIMMNYNEHNPPHFHARYGRSKISVRIADGVVTGQFPTRSLAHVLEWWNLHRYELLEDWARAEQHLPLNPIAPLE